MVKNKWNEFDETGDEQKALTEQGMNYETI